MNELIRFGSPLAATLFAMWRTRAFPLLYLYFFANLLYLSATEIAYLRNWQYDSIYAIFTGIWLFFAFLIVWDALPRRAKKVRLLSLPAIVAIGLTRHCYIYMDGRLTHRGWITLIEAACLVFLGIVLGAAAGYAWPTCNVLLALSATWIALWLFLDLFLLRDSWTGLYWVPAVIVSVGFTAAGLAIPQKLEVKHER